MVYLTDLLSPYNPSRSLRSVNSRLLVIPRISRSTKEGRAFSHLAPKLWNSLPDIVRSSDSLSQFKTRLKTHLFTQAFIYIFWSYSYCKFGLYFINARGELAHDWAWVLPRFFFSSIGSSDGVLGHHWVTWWISLSLLPLACSVGDIQIKWPIIPLICSTKFGCLFSSNKQVVLIDNVKQLWYNLYCEYIWLDLTVCEKLQ